MMIGSVNAGCRGQTDIAILSLWGVCRQQCPGLRVLFVSECDQLQVHSQPREVGPLSVHRHWPGAGARAMCFLIDKSIAADCRVWWNGRAGTVVIKATRAGQRTDVSFTGWHGAHGEEMAESLGQLRACLRRCRTTRQFVLGDTNIDQLDSGQWDLNDGLWPHPGTGASDALNKALLSQVADDTGLSVLLPTSILDSPGGPWVMVVAVAPVTRLPQGEQV